MAKDESKHLNQSALEADRNAFAALQTITGYLPANSTFALGAISAAHAALAAAQQTEAQAAAQATARDDAVTREWAFHNLMLGAKDQVVAQFGRDSNEVQADGRRPDRSRRPDGGRRPVSGV